MAIDGLFPVNPATSSFKAFTTAASCVIPIQLIIPPRAVLFLGYIAARRDAQPEFCSSAPQFLEHDAGPPGPVSM